MSYETKLNILYINNYYRCVQVIYKVIKYNFLIMLINS